MDAAVPAFMSVTGADSETALRYLTVRNGRARHRAAVARAVADKAWLPRVCVGAGVQVFDGDVDQAVGLYFEQEGAAQPSGCARRAWADVAVTVGRAG